MLNMGLGLRRVEAALAIGTVVTVVGVEAAHPIRSNVLIGAIETAHAIGAIVALVGIEATHAIAAHVPSAYGRTQH